MDWSFVSNRSRDAEVMAQRMSGEGLASAEAEKRRAGREERFVGQERSPLEAGIKIPRQNSRHGYPRPARG